MYTDEDYKSNQKHIRKLLLLYGIPAFILLGGIVVSFVFRIKLLTMALTVLLCWYCIFIYDLQLAPQIAYNKLIGSILYGRTRTVKGSFKEMDDTQIYKEGLYFYPVTISVGDMNNENDDRLLYYDANLSKPNWKTGDVFSFTVHDKNIGAWEMSS